MVEISNCVRFTLFQVKDRIKDLEKQINHSAVMENDFFEGKLKEYRKNLLSREGNSAKCEELLETVETQKDAALQYTLKTVAKNFREIMKTIVHPGRGFVRWVYDNDVDDELQNALVKNLALPFSFSLCHITLIIVLVKCQSLQEPDVMQLRGVAIGVSFDNEKRKDLKSLSGGQQSVVSLALVFSILQIDRAPFYLFDEADMVYCLFFLLNLFLLYS